jgi:hypothetical protein
MNVGLPENEVVNDVDECLSREEVITSKLICIVEIVSD